MSDFVLSSSGIRIVGAMIIMLAISGAAFGQLSSQDSSKTVEQAAPLIQLLRHTENWSFLSDDSRHFGSLDPLKYVPLGGDAYATFGADVRLRLDSYTGTDYPPKPEEGGQAFLLQRYMTHAGLHIGSRFRLFTQLKSNHVLGLDSPRPLDRNDLDLHELFIDAVLFRQQRAELNVRLGRQEINHGRLIDMREGPNVRMSFDGVRLFLKTKSWQVEGLLARPVEADFGTFDDGWVNPDETLWDLRLMRSLQFGSGLQPVKTTLYYFGVDRESTTFAQETGPETRHTIGLKMGAPPINVSGISLEGAVQFGEFGDHRISSWFATVESGYRLKDTPLEPRFGFLARAASGDRDSLDLDLQTFSAPYSSQRTGIQSGFIGAYANLYQVQPSVAVYPYDGVGISLRWALFWRQSVHEPAYTSAGFPLQPSPESLDRFIGHVPKFISHYQAGPYLRFELRYEWLIGGDYLGTPATKTNAHYLALETTFKF